MSQHRPAERRRARLRIGLLVGLAGVITVLLGATVANAATPNNGAGQGGRPALTLNQRIAAYAKTFVGRYRYVHGGSSPATGFDCSGLTHYIYQHNGRTTARTAQHQYPQFRRVARRSARPGRFVSFHTGWGRFSHAGVCAGSNATMTAATPQDGIRHQRIWS